MTQLSILDQIDVCERRHRLSPESVEAHEKIVRHKSEWHNRIMKLAVSRGEYGITLHEVAGAFGKTPNAISGRLSELKMQGKLKQRNKERRNGAAVLVAV